MNAAGGAVDGVEPAAAPINRMGMAVMALIGVIISAYLLMHKLGIIGSVLCGTGSCELVQATKWASFLGVPVPLWGMVGYGAILAAAVSGIQPGRGTDRRLALVLLAGSTGAFLFSLYLSAIEAFVIDAWCRWCIGSAVVATLLFLLSLPEYRRWRAR